MAIGVNGFAPFFPRFFRPFERICSVFRGGFFAVSALMLNGFDRHKWVAMLRFFQVIIFYFFFDLSLVYLFRLQPEVIVSSTRIW